MTEQQDILTVHHEVGKIVSKYGPESSIPALQMIIAEIIVCFIEKPKHHKAVKLIQHDIEKNIKHVEERLKTATRTTSTIQ